MDIFSPIKIGSTELKNRIAMAPLTRRRSPGNLPNEMNVEYYKQRAGAGLIISEGTQVSSLGVGYINTPGIYSEEQAEGWKKVTDAVHSEGGKIFAQLWHVGRTSHPDFHNGELPISPSAINPNIEVLTYGVKKKSVTPKEMTSEDIVLVKNQFKNSARLAIDSGFDGVEIHGANGYLIDQFICDGSNKRTDKYGGKLENRLRFPLEVIEEVANEIGNDKVGIRFSPSGIFGSMRDTDPKITFGKLVNELNNFDLAYIHLIEPFQTEDKRYLYPDNYLNYGEVTPYFRNIYKGNIITCTSMTKEKGNQLIKDGITDMIAMGKYFISNPDLVYRLKNDLKLNEYDVKSFYDMGAEGYIDYPFYNGNE